MCGRVIQASTPDQLGLKIIDALDPRIPYWCKDKPKPPPINAKAETVDRLPMFREAYRKRRCIVPIDGFFEWMAIKGTKVKQPYAIAMQDRSPFVGRIHDRMPAILRPEDYSRWLALDPDGPNLLQPFPSEPMIIWPISTRVNSPKNDDPDLLEPLADADACWPQEGNSA